MIYDIVTEVVVVVTTSIYTNLTSEVVTITKYS